MLTKIEFWANDSQNFSVNLEDQDSEVYIKGISGLDPVKAEMTATGVAAIDGQQYQSSRRGSRNIIISFGVRDIFDRTIRALRHDLYQYFMPKSPIRMVFYDDEYSPLEINGRVEIFEFPLFQKDPEAGVSILCFDPDFYDLRQNSMITSIPIPASEGGVMNIDYDGTVGTGLIMEFDLVNPSGLPNGLQVTMQEASGNSQTMEIAHPFLKDDKLTIDTNPGNKSVMLLRDNQLDSILYALSYQSDWLSLSNGTNVLTVSATWPSTTPASSLTVKWTNKYGGL